MVAGVVIRSVGPGDAHALVACVRRCYGDTYLDEGLYDVDVVCSRILDGSFVPVAAFSGNAIVGMMALTLRQPTDLVAEAGLTMVDPACRGHGLATAVGRGIGAEAARRGFVGLVDYPVTVHGATQRLGREIGTYCGYLESNVPATVRFGVGERRRRSPSLVRYLALSAAPSRRVRVPDRYRDLLGEIYERARLPRQLSDAAPIGPEPLALIKLEPRRDRVTVTEVPSETAGAELLENAVELALATDAAAIHVDLRLDTGIKPAVLSHLRAIGFYFGGVIPEHHGTDILRLQRAAHGPAAPTALGRDARWIVNAVMADRSGR